MRAVPLLLLAAALGCNPKTPPTPAPTLVVGVPTDAIFYLAAPTLAELAAAVEPARALRTHIGGDAPAWFACTKDHCLLHRDAPAAAAHEGDRATVPTQTGSLVLWGVPNPADVDTVLTAWTAGEAPATDRAHGSLDLTAAFGLWQINNANARAFLADAQTEAARLDFDFSATAQGVELHFKRDKGGLGVPTGDLPTVTGFAKDDMLGVVRLAAAPSLLWNVFQVSWTPERRAEFEALRPRIVELGLDVERDIIATLTGQIAVFLYSLTEGAEHSIGELIRLRATDDALVLGVQDADTLRRTLDAVSQLSQASTVRGSLVPQDLGRDPAERRWAWMVDGDLHTSIILTDDLLVIVDSAAALDRFEQRAQPLPAKHADALGHLLQTSRRSGVFLSLPALRTLLPDAVPDKLTAVSLAITATEDGREEATLRLSW